MELLSAGTSRDDRDERWGDGAARGGDGYGAACGGDGYGAARGGDGYGAAWGGDGARGKLGLPGASRDLDDGRRGTAGDTRRVATHRGRLDHAIA